MKNDKKLPAITKTSRGTWANAIAWRIHQAVAIVVGLEPSLDNVFRPSDIELRIADENTRRAWSALYDEAKVAMNLDILPWRAPTSGGRLYLNRLVTPSEFVKFVTSRKYKLPPQLGKLLPKTTPTGSEVNDASRSWTCKAKDIAQRIGNEKWKMGIRSISAHGVCQAVATELEKDPVNHGKQGPRSSHNVRTVGLQGWKFTPPKA